MLSVPTAPVPPGRTLPALVSVPPLRFKVPTPWITRVGLLTSAPLLSVSVGLLAEKLIAPSLLGTFVIVRDRCRSIVPALVTCALRTLPKAAGPELRSVPLLVSVPEVKFRVAASVPEQQVSAEFTMSIVPLLVKPFATVSVAAVLVTPVPMMIDAPAAFTSPPLIKLVAPPPMLIVP